MFKEYIGKLTAAVGQQRASEILANSIFLVSAGNNDIAITYSLLLATTRPFPLYVAYLVSNAKNFFKVPLPPLNFLTAKFICFVLLLYHLMFLMLNRGHDTTKNSIVYRTLITCLITINIRVCE